MENWLSQMKTANNLLAERYAEYPAPAHEQQLYYTYEPSSPSHGHVASSKHHYGGGHKSNAAMSALTLLAFLFFLHILQQCLKEHMTAMSSPQVMVVSAGREGEQLMAKASNKNKADKAGFVEIQPSEKRKNKINDEKNVANSSNNNEDIFLTRIATAEYTPRGIHTYANKNVIYASRSSMFDGFVSAMDDI